MPMIGGKKMACEPCIRGHRSTKCNHQNDRMMIEVRKPGRPLSTCPHPVGKNCVCGGIAALPRRGKCACPSQVTARKPIKDEEMPDFVPMFPDNNPPYRVQRAGSRVARQGSFNPVAVAGLARMDPSQLNISTYVSVPVPVPIAGPGPGPGPGFIPQFDNPFAPSWPGDLQPQQPGTQQGAVISVPGPQPETTASTFHHFINGERSPSVSSLNLSRKSSQSSSDSNGATYTPRSSPESTSRVVMSAGRQGGCCGPAMNKPDPQAAVSYAQPQQDNDHPMTLSYCQATDIYSTGIQQQNSITFPPGVGTSDNPLQYSQYQLYACAPTFNPSYAVPEALSYPAELDDNLDEAGTTHECSCGDTCACANCIQHPWNETNMNQWNSANNVMRYQESLDLVMFDPTPGGDVTPLLADGTVQPARIPAPEAVAADEETIVSAENYFFIQIDGCAGSKENCHCGSDCKCVGCQVHGEDNAAG